MPLPNTIDLPLTDDDSIGLTLNRIAAGSFLIGARGHSNREQPVHVVCIPYDFYLGKYPVTQLQFKVWTELAGVDHKNNFSGNDTHPAEDMSWHEAVDFSRWLTQRYQLLSKNHPVWPADYRCALPSEAQWEYACSAWQEVSAANGAMQRNYTEYHTGDGEAALREAGWYVYNSGLQTQAVGLKLPNRHGLYDMHGNVEEWCADGWDEHAYRFRPGVVEDPIVPAGELATRVVRGGSWNDPAILCRAAYRFSVRADSRFRGLGFRVGLFPVHSCQSEQSNNQQAG